MSEVTVGIEIHQQLDTKKLFCHCDSRLLEEESFTLLRRLRPTQSELGEIDRAALVQAEKKLRFRYQAPHAVSCLVDADEEPPHRANDEAIDVVLTIASMLRAKVVDEIHFMRKIVVDGSNTAGFQRTALVAVDGYLEIDGKKISVPTYCLEEDAARKVETKAGEITYRLDRLGIPLIEIATGPDMHSPEEVREVAQKLGSIMRATRKVKRGIGTIREDLNISIPGGSRVEIKGVQDLRKLPLYVEKEMERQRSLLAIRDLLLQRKASALTGDLRDMTNLFEDSTSKVIASALKKGGKVMGTDLKGFAGVLKSADGKMRMGAELAQYARTKGVAGIFHSDELPGYGIDKDKVEEIRSLLSLGSEDAFVLCASDANRAQAALEAVRERATEALKGVPEETRDPLPDGTSAYSRPLPGAARMYPETDVPPITIGAERLQGIVSHLPELPEQRTARISSHYGIHGQQARQLVREGYDDLLEEVASSKKELAPIFCRTVLNTFPEIERQGADLSMVSEETIKEIFLSLSRNEFAKEALPDIFIQVAKGKSLKEAIGELGLSSLGREEASEIVAAIVRQKGDFVREKGMNAVGPLMGAVMEELRGRVDGKTASELLKTEIKKFLESE
jgi:glutamyl-tRNA(Gln) amidotransferase subunit E